MNLANFFTSISEESALVRGWRVARDPATQDLVALRDQLRRDAAKSELHSRLLKEIHDLRKPGEVLRITEKQD